MSMIHEALEQIGSITAMLEQTVGECRENFLEFSPAVQHDFMWAVQRATEQLEFWVNQPNFRGEFVHDLQHKFYGELSEELPRLHALLLVATSSEGHEKPLLIARNEVAFGDYMNGCLRSAYAVQGWLQDIELRCKKPVAA